MENRALKVLAVLIALGIALMAGAVIGGSLIYGLTRIDNPLPVARAQTIDPGHGVVVAAVETGGPAAITGVVRGDILLELDGEVLKDGNDLTRLLKDRAPGAEIELAVLHGDKERTLVTTLGDRDGRAFLGIVPCGGIAVEVEKDIKLTIEGSGAMVVQVVPDGPADAAGVQDGDLILTVNGQELGAERDLAEVIASYQPGDMVTLEIERPGEGSVKLQVTLGEHTEREGSAYLGVRYRPLPHVDMLREHAPGEFREFHFEDLPFEIPEGEFHLELPFDLPGGELQQGAIVQSVDEGSPASEAGLTEGDVITGIDGTAVEGPEALSETVGEHEPGDTISLTVFRPGDEVETELAITLSEHPDQGGKAYLGVTVGGFYRMQRFYGGDEDLPPGEFKFPFPFEMPFEHEFEFEWPPGHHECPGGPGCSDDSV
jgi:S1-C subfamily serine protease